MTALLNIETAAERRVVQNVSLSAPAPVYTDAAGEPQSIRWLQPCLVLRCAAIHVIVIIGNKIARSARIYDGAGKRMVARSDATAIHGTLQSSGQTPVGAIAGPL